MPLAVLGLALVLAGFAAPICLTEDCRLVGEIFIFPSALLSPKPVDTGGLGVDLAVEAVLGVGVALWLGGFVIGVVEPLVFFTGRFPVVAAGGLEGKEAGLARGSDVDFCVLGGKALGAIFCVPAAVLFTACVAAAGLTATFF